MESVVHAPSPQSLVAALPEIFSFAVQWNVNPFIIAVTIHFSSVALLCAKHITAKFLAEDFLLVVVGKGSSSALKYVPWVDMRNG